VDKLIKVALELSLGGIGYFLLWEKIGWMGCLGVFLIFFANNIQLFDFIKGVKR
jgi:hypothetical protein